jgi:hypothetical protein
MGLLDSVLGAAMSGGQGQSGGAPEPNMGKHG